MKNAIYLQRYLKNNFQFFSYRKTIIYLWITSWLDTFNRAHDTCFTNIFLYDRIGYVVICVITNYSLVLKVFLFEKSSCDQTKFLILFVSPVRADDETILSITIWIQLMSRMKIPLGISLIKLVLKIKVTLITTNFAVIRFIVPYSLYQMVIIAQNVGDIMFKGERKNFLKN